MADKKADYKDDLIDRGNYNPTLAGRSTLIGLRALDIPLQYAILGPTALGSSLLHRVGLQTLPAGAAANTGISLVDNLGLSPYRLALLGIPSLSTIRQIYWALFVGREELSPQGAAVVGFFQSTGNSINSLLFTTRLFSASQSSGAVFPQTPLLVGATLAVGGLALEVLAEEQRKWFKKDPQNKGKAYNGGLFSLVRHPNYGAFTVYKFGYSLAAGGWIWAGLTAAFFTWMFANEAIPKLDDYCGKRYKEQWEQYKRDVPYKLFPYIY